MHSSAFGAAALMVLRSFSSAARLSALKAARYSSMVLGLDVMACAPDEVKGQAGPRLNDDRVPACHYLLAHLDPRTIRRLRPASKQWHTVSPDQPVNDRNRLTRAGE